MAARTGADPVVDLEPSLLVLSALATCRAALMHWCDQGGRGALADTLHDAFERAGAGLAAPSSPAASGDLPGAGETTPDASPKGTALKDPVR
jgi:hypothetical protein